MTIATIVDRIVAVLGNVSARSLATSFREPVLEEFKRAQVPVLKFALCVSISALGMVLVAMGAIQALVLLQLPLWAAYLGLGSISLLGGFALVARKG